MQAVRPSSRKRDAETAFQAPSWDLDEDASQHESTLMSIQDNQAFVEQTLGELILHLRQEKTGVDVVCLRHHVVPATSRKQTKKIVHNLLDETQKIFSGVETEVKTLQDTYSMEM